MLTSLPKKEKRNKPNLVSFDFISKLCKFSFYLWHDLGSLFCRMWWSAWQVDAAREVSQFKLHRFTTHLEHGMLNNQSPLFTIISLCSKKKWVEKRFCGQSKNAFTLVTCWTLRYASFFSMTRCMDFNTLNTNFQHSTFVHLLCALQ